MLAAFTENHAAKRPAKVHPKSIQHSDRTSPKFYLQTFTLEVKKTYASPLCKKHAMKNPKLLANPLDLVKLDKCQVLKCWVTPTVIIDMHDAKPMHLSVCLLARLPACLLACLPWCLSLSLSLPLYLSLSLSLSPRLFTYVSVCLCACVCVSLCLCALVCRCVRMSVCMSACVCVSWSVGVSLCRCVCLCGCVCVGVGVSASVSVRLSPSRSVCESVRPVCLSLSLSLCPCACVGTRRSLEEWPQSSKTATSCQTYRGPKVITHIVMIKLAIIPRRTIILAIPPVLLTRATACAVPELCPRQGHRGGETHRQGPLGCPPDLPSTYRSTSYGRQAMSKPS